MAWAAPATVGFSSSNFTVNEDGELAFITVTRDDSTGISMVNYATSDGTAKAGTDYVATSGMLIFNVGDSAKTISVPVVSDEIRQGNLTVNLALTDPSDGVLLGTAASTLTIIDDDPLPAAVAFQSITYNSVESDLHADITVSCTWAPHHHYHRFSQRRGG